MNWHLIDLHNSIKAVEPAIIALSACVLLAFVRVWVLFRAALFTISDRGNDCLGGMGVEFYFKFEARLANFNVNILRFEKKPYIYVGGIYAANSSDGGI